MPNQTTHPSVTSEVLAQRKTHFLRKINNLPLAVLQDRVATFLANIATAHEAMDSRMGCQGVQADLRATADFFLHGKTLGS